MIPTELQDIDKTKPLTDEQYEIVKSLSDVQKKTVMYGFTSHEWSQQDISRHYRSCHYPVVKYGPNWTLTPPKSKK